MSSPEWRPKCLKNYRLKIICSHCKRNKSSSEEVTQEVIVDDVTFHMLMNFYDKDAFLSIDCVFDEFPNYQDWYKRGIYKDLPPYLIKSWHERLSGEERKSLFSTESYEREKKRYYESTKKVIESENNKLKEMLTQRNSIIHKIRDFGFDAKLEYCCEKCDSDNNVKHFEVCVKAKNEDKWYKTIPFIFGNEINARSLIRYIMLLDRLKKKKRVDLAKIFKEIDI